MNHLSELKSGDSISIGNYQNKQKVWIGGKVIKGKILTTFPPFGNVPIWAVPVEIKDAEGAGWFCYIHYTLLTIREKKKKEA